MLVIHIQDKSSRMATSTPFQQAESQTAEPTLEQAIDLHQAGSLEEAAIIYLSILETRPNHPEANYKLGVLAVETHHFDAAIVYFNAALDADPTRGQFWLGYIDALFQAGQLDDARQVLALARQQGLEGETVDALAACIGAAEPLIEASASEVPMSTNTSAPQREEVETLLALFSAGDLAQAVALAEQLAGRYPGHPFGWKTLGVAQKLLGHEAEALAPMRRAVALDPVDVESHYNLGVVLQALGRLGEAEASYRYALQLVPSYADASLNLGVVLHALGRLDEAETSLRQALVGKPQASEVSANLGAVLNALGRPKEAEASLRQALEIKPDNASAHNNLGIVLKKQGSLYEAAASCQRALELDAQYADAHANLGAVYQAMGRTDEAMTHFREALQIDPGNAAAHVNIAIELQATGALDEADSHFQQALTIKPDDAEVHANRGNLLYNAGRLDEAEACYRIALQLKPDDPKLFIDLGSVFRFKQRYYEAEACFRDAIRLAPDDPENRNLLGGVLLDMGRPIEAEACFRELLMSWPDNAALYNNLALALQSLGRQDEAVASFRKASQIAPIYHTSLLHLLLLGESSTPEQVFEEHVAFGKRVETVEQLVWAEGVPTRDPERVLRIGFVSGDFFHHAVASFIEPMLQQLSHDPALSLHAYYSHFVNDAVTARLKNHFASWNPVTGLTDQVLAKKIRSDGIDILIDLSGHTENNRLAMFAYKPAPIQASWIGYPGTTGLTAMDYYFADRFLLPPGRLDHFFTEKIVRLPANTPFNPTTFAPPVNPLPALSKGFVTFGSFNRPNKLSREVIALWSSLLRALPDSKMLLGGMSESGHHDWLSALFEEEGIARDRLVFHPRTNIKDYLFLHHEVDLCLDTFPYNGGTTTQYALWMGVPTLTLIGKGMPGRVGAAILGRVGIEQFAVEKPEDFVAQGLYWAGNLTELAELRAGMRDYLVRSPLRRPEVLADGLNHALRTMWRRWCTGLAPESFEVKLDDLQASVGEQNP